MITRSGDDDQLVYVFTVIGCLFVTGLLLDYIPMVSGIRMRMAWR